MNFDIILSFSANILLLLGLAVIYSIFPFTTKTRSISKTILIGFLVTLIGVIIMSTPFELAPGIMFDARSVAISTTAMFIGFIPTIIAGLFMSLYRIYIGGQGALTGVLWIISSGVIGLLWRKYRLKNPKFENIKITWIELYLFSLLIQFVMVVLMLTLPDEVRASTLRATSFYLIAIYPLGGLLISQFMLIQRQRYFQHIKTINSEVQYRNLFHKSKAIMFLLDAETGEIYDVNETAIEKYGYTLEEFRNLNIKDINTLPNDEVQAEIDKARIDKKSFFKFKHILKDNSIIDVEVHSGPIELNGKQFLLTSLFDVTDKVEKERLYKDVDEKLKATLLSVGEGIVATDKSSRITLINDRALKILGGAKNPTRRKIYDVFRIYSGSKEISFKQIFNNCVKNKVSFKSGDAFSLIKNYEDTEIFVDFTISPINYEEGVNHGAILVIRDVTLEKASKTEIKYISHHDFLTKLYNRFYFEEQLKRLDTKRQLPLTLILGDVNGLKLLNDTFSHLEGDNLLIEIAKIFKKATRAEDIVARWGGDEFVILLPQTSYLDSQRIYSRVKDLCNKSMYSPITPSISLGIATKIDEKEDIYNILKTAEERMYKEKLQEGRTMRENLIDSLENTLLSKSNEKKEHNENMIKLSEKFAIKLSLDNDSTKTLTLLARFHDIGKIAIDKEILVNPEELNESDWEKIKTHPEVGSRIVKSIPELQHLEDGILFHHEHFDGTGYPYKLKGIDIPLLSRAIAIIDAYEVMTSGRVYRPAISHKNAILELQKQAGIQFDPNLVSLFISMFEEHN